MNREPGSGLYTPGLYPPLFQNIESDNVYKLRPSWLVAFTWQTQNDNIKTA